MVACRQQRVLSESCRLAVAAHTGCDVCHGDDGGDLDIGSDVAGVDAGRHTQLCDNGREGRGRERDSCVDMHFIFISK